MSRLTNQIRQSMLKTVLNHAFLAQEESTKRAKFAAAENIYADVYGAHLTAMQSLPKGFLLKNNYIYVGIAGQVHEINFKDSRLIGYKHDSRHSADKAKLYVGDEPVTTEWLKAVDACNDVKSRREAMYREVNAVLESVQTFKKLWEVWPECKSLLEKYEAKPAIAILPAIQVDRLNQTLGLPALKEEA